MTNYDGKRIVNMSADIVWEIHRHLPRPSVSESRTRQEILFLNDYNNSSMKDCYGSSSSYTTPTRGL